MEVGLTVGGRVASTVISKLINELIEYAKDQNKMQAGLKDELARLQKAMPKIQAVVDGVGQGLIKEENPALAKWLWQLRDAADQADDVMDEIKYNYEKERILEAEKNNVNKAITNFKTIFLRAVNKDSFLKRLKEALKAIDEVAADVGDFYRLVHDMVKDQKYMVKSAISSRETSSVLNVRSAVFGREKEKEDIIKKLLNPDCKTKVKNFAILPIIGVGGVGKTTLVQLVYNDPIIKEHFELRIWVCISNNFDVVLLTKKLYESAFKEKADFVNFDLIQEKLKEKLQTQRFLVVFDDAWNDNDNLGWEKLVAPLKDGKSGSMVLLTSRLKSVAKLIGPNVMDSIILEGLDECRMWDLLKEYAFGDEDPDFHKELVEIGRDIVEKLEGSPLAAKTVGGILCSHLNEVHWRSILESELWRLEQKENDIMPALRLTYQYLPPHLKPCFSFCSIFPQDYCFSKNNLVNMWIALGMVPHSVNGTISPEDVGSKYFDDMLSKSIFIRIDQLNDPCDTYDRFVMHDLIHDLSVLVSQGECLRTSSTKKLVHVPNTVRHLYAHIDGSCELSISGLKNLRTLILSFDGSNHPKQDSVLVTKMLKGMENLRVLILYASNLSEFPESASKLMHLRYLSLSSSTISAFPKSLSKLYLLETIEYNDYESYQLKHADVLGKLINLRHLFGPQCLLKKIAGIGRLTSLQELSFYVGENSGFKICELSDMRELRNLEIINIENVGSCEEVIQANLINKVTLKKLSLTWGPIGPKQANEDVLDHLEPHNGLKELRIMNYYGTGRPPIWLRTQTLSKLECLQISWCNFVELPCLEELPLLKYIRFYQMNAVERIIHECNRSSAVDAFPSLERLSFTKMRAIKEWYLEKEPHKWMQCLKELMVRKCPRLHVIPPIPVGIKELRLASVGLNALPNLWNDQNNKSGIFPALVVMSIRYCQNLVSLTEGLFQNPEPFMALEELEIHNCEKLMYLPPGGFNKFISLKNLDIHNCPKIDILLVPEFFLPSALQKLSISSCGDLDTTLSKALESINSLVELRLTCCENITSLPPKEVFSRWKTLNLILFTNCPVLASLESLLGLSSIENVCLIVSHCPKLSQAIPSIPPNPGSDRDDTLIFTPSNNGLFLVKKAYKIISGGSSTSANSLHQPTVWSVIWKKGYVLPRLRVFLWKVVNNALPLGKILGSRGIHLDQCCSMCADSDEDVMHMLFHCPFSRLCWFTSPLALTSHVLGPTASEALELMASNLDEDQWTAFVSVIWGIWRCRNDCAYSGIKPTLEKFYKYWADITNESHLAKAGVGPPVHLQNQNQELYSPREYTCAVDGSWLIGRRGGAGFVLSKDEVLVAYRSTPIAACCPLQAEALALLEAVNYVVLSGIDSCEFQTDCQTIAVLVSQPGPPIDADWRVYWEIFDIWRTLRSLPNFKCRYISRSHNELADSLAKKGRTLEESFTGYTFPLFSPAPFSEV